MINGGLLKKSFNNLKKDISEIKEKILEISTDINIKKNEEKNLEENELSQRIKNAEKFFRGKNILITGGLGFIGSNLAHRLVNLNPGKIIIADSIIKNLGANFFNIKGIEKQLKVYKGGEGDLRNMESMRKILKNVDIVFNLAGSVSHMGSKDNPLFDLQINLGSHLHFLEACRQIASENKKEIKIVYSGTRDQYGKVKQRFLPVKEDYLIEEIADPQGINKSAAEFYHLWYRNFGIKSCSLRLSNIYGPRHIMSDAEQGVLNWFVRRAIDNETLELWGGGEILRDFIYVDDVVDALLMTMSSTKSDGKAYNLGAYRKKNGLYEQIGKNIKTIKETAEIITNIAGTGSIKTIPYPEDRKPLEPGHFYADSTKIYEDIGWEPKTGLIEGIKKTIEFYRKNKKYYW